MQRIVNSICQSDILICDLFFMISIEKGSHCILASHTFLGMKKACSALAPANPRWDEDPLHAGLNQHLVSGQQVNNILLITWHVHSFLATSSYTLGRSWPISTGGKKLLERIVTSASGSAVETTEEWTGYPNGRHVALGQRNWTRSIASKAPATGLVMAAITQKMFPSDTGAAARTCADSQTWPIYINESMMYSQVMVWTHLVTDVLSTCFETLSQK